MKFCKDCKWSKKGSRWPGFRYEDYFCHHPEHITKYDLVDGTPEVSECERHRRDEKNWDGDLLSKCGEKGLLWEEKCEEPTDDEEIEYIAPTAPRTGAPRFKLIPVRDAVEKIKNLFRRNN